MRMIILDSNIFFAALIRKSHVRRLILEYEGKFLFPEFIFLEAKRHQEELQRKSGLSLQEFHSLFNVLLNKTTIVKNEQVEEYK